MFRVELFQFSWIGENQNNKFLVKRIFYKIVVEEYKLFFIEIIDELILVLVCDDFIDILFEIF